MEGNYSKFEDSLAHGLVPNKRHGFGFGLGLTYFLLMNVSK